LVGAVVAALGLGGAFWLGRSVVRAEPLHPVVALTLAWGSGPDQVGLAPVEGEGYVGPNTFFVDEEGNFHILDAINESLKKFSPQGTLLDNTPLPKGIARGVKQIIVTGGVVAISYLNDTWGSDLGFARDGKFQAVPLTEQVPGFVGFYWFERTTQPKMIVVRRDIPPEDEASDKAPFKLVLGLDGRVIRTLTSRNASADEKIPRYMIRTTPSGNLALEAWDLNGQPTKSIDLGYASSDLVWGVGLDGKGDLYLHARSAAPGTTSTWLLVYDRGLNLVGRHELVIDQDWEAHEYQPTLSAGNMEMVGLNGIYCEMRYMKDGFTIFQYSPR
jgi:hypothetical protein